MVETVFSSPTLWISAGAMLLFVVAAAFGSMTVLRSEHAESDYRRQAALMPSYLELQAAQATLDEKRSERDELLEEMKILRQEQAEIDRHRLDAEHWRSLADQAKRDYDGRQSLIDEVESLRQEYDDAARDLAEKNEELAELTRKRSTLAMDIEAAQEKLKELEEQRSRAEDLTNQLQQLGAQRDELLAELNGIRDQRDERHRAAFEVDQLERRKSELEQALAARHVRGQHRHLALGFGRAERVAVLPRAHLIHLRRRGKRSDDARGAVRPNATTATAPV